jgi:hypothetical protein
MHCHPSDHRRFANELTHWKNWVNELCGQRPTRAYFATATFDRYKDRYLTDGGNTAKVDRNDVRRGLTIARARTETAHIWGQDLTLWHRSLLKRLLGGRYNEHRDRQPFGLGWLDQPAYKSPRNQVRRHPGDDFLHAHFALLVPELESPLLPPLTVADHFDELWQAGELDGLWKRFNQTGGIHLVEEDPHLRIGESLDYMAKSAKRDPLFQQHQILLGIRDS